MPEPQLKPSQETNSHTVVTATEARQGNTLGVVRYVLAISLMLALIAFVVLYAVYFWPA